MRDVPEVEQTAHDAVNGLAVAARDIIRTAQGAGVSVLGPDGKRRSVGATSAIVLEADDLQYELGEGPRITAWSSVEPVYIRDTRSEKRWPQWTTAAAAVGVRSCLSVPLERKNEALGAMKVYSDQPDAFSDANRKLLINLSRSTSALLGHIQASHTPQRISNDIKASLAVRDTVGIARGILMERLHLDKQAAMDHLIELATEENISIGAIAARISDRQDGPGVTSGA